MATETLSALSENIPELPPAPPRESLIATAIKFLQNSKVSQSPIEQKRQFLKKKGLTDEEIQIAITRSGIDVTPSPPSHSGSGPLVSVQNHPPVSTWTRIREFSAIAVIVGGVVYGLYHLYKRYIEPFFMKTQKIQDENLSRLEEGIRTVNDELGQNMQEIHTKMDEIQEKIDEQSSRISQVAASVTSYRAQNSGVSDSAIGELKAEITSIKGLLLSRNQFPSSSIPRPVIPSWQMKRPEEDRPSEQEKSLENGERMEDSGAEQLNGEGETQEEETQNINGFAPTMNGTEVKKIDGKASLEQEIVQNSFERSET